MGEQSAHSLGMIVVDGSDNDETKEVCHSQIPNLKTKIIYHRATTICAATQRSQAIQYATQNIIILFGYLTMTLSLSQIV